MDIIAKLKDKKLLGRGGASFPVWQKWQAVKDNGSRRGHTYIIANGSEGEPAVLKDEYILKHKTKEFILGLKVALDFFKNSEAIIYLNPTYYQKYKKKIEKYSLGLPIKFFKKIPRYIAGEETAMLNHLEGKRPEPREKPPYPTEKGLYGFPTLINNIETFYRVYEIKDDLYKGMAFYTIVGDVKNKGVFELPADLSIREVLAQTKNLPKFKYFLQVGGGASGEILTEDEIDQKISGVNSIKVFNAKKTDPKKLMRYWADFYARENCDKCTPCREGSYQIMEILDADTVDYGELRDIFFVLEKSSYCSLGRYMSIPYKTLIDKVILKNEKS